MQIEFITKEQQHTYVSLGYALGVDKTGILGIKDDLRKQKGISHTIFKNWKT